MSKDTPEDPRLSAIRAALEAAAKMLRETSDSYSRLGKWRDMRGDYEFAAQYANEAAAYESAPIYIAMINASPFTK